MITKTEPTYWSKIYLSGSIEKIKDVCRKYCFEVGLCVTIKEVCFIYTGGEEFGVEIGLVNYPRFPSTQEFINIKAGKLANILLDETFQLSILIVNPHKTQWIALNKKEDIMLA